MTQEERERYGIGCTQCRWCNKTLEKAKVGRPKRFCSPECKEKWRRTEWRVYPDKTRSEISRMNVKKRWEARLR